MQNELTGTGTGKTRKYIKYTPEQRKAYYAKLRAEWAKSKALAIEHPEKVDAIVAEVRRQGINASAMSIWFTHLEMQALKLEGLPHVDCKTFKLWKAAGFTVKRGEKAKLHGVTWIHPVMGQDANGEDIEDQDTVYPKVYKLFHRSQVVPTGTNEPEEEPEAPEPVEAAPVKSEEPAPVYAAVFTR